jgi:hypothetical protein
MRKGSRTKVGLVISGTAVVVLTGSGWALASDGEDADDRPIEGMALERAEEAALAETGGGTVTSTEVDGDADGYYEVEVANEDGSEVEVNLDRDFQVTGTETDDSDGGADDGDDAADDDGPLDD